MGFVKPIARALTGVLTVFASLWGYILTPELVWLFSAIAGVGVINFAIAIHDERQIRADRQMLSEMREYMLSLSGPTDIPAHLQDMSRLSNAQLKALTAKVTDNLRQFAVTSHEGRYGGAWWDGVPGWESLSEEQQRWHRDQWEQNDDAKRVERGQAFLRDYRPDALAVWDELKKRGAYDRATLNTHVGGHVIEMGSLAGARPIEEAATGLEAMARQLGD